MDPGGVQQLEVQILIDSGNSLDQCGAITQQCADKLGLTLQPLDLEINTADKNHTMRPCGQVEDLHIWFPGQGEATLLKSVLVLPDLDGNVDSGYKFLQKNRGNLPFENKEGRPVLHLPGQSKGSNAPIILQMSKSMGKIATRTVLGAKTISRIPIKIEKPLLTEAGTFRRVPMVFTGLYKCTRWTKHKATFQLGFINPGEQDETLTPGLQGFYVETCVDQKVDYPQKSKLITPTGQIRQADQLEDTNRITHSQRGIQVYNPGLNRITGGQGIWTTGLGATLFHLDKEIPEVYSGSEALTDCMLKKIKVQNLQNETDRKQTLIYTNMDWLEGQELNTTKSIWATESGATILPLGNKRPEVYSGSKALPDSLLERLQVQNLQYRVDIHRLMPSEPERLTNLTLDHNANLSSEDRMQIKKP